LRRDTIVRAKKDPMVRSLVSEEDAPLLSALKAKRRALAEEARVPAYVVFADRTLIEMAEKRPDTLDAMARIGGVGAKKLERFGALFLSVILGANAPDTHPARRKLATSGGGDLFDTLQDIQTRLSRGECGTLKPVTLTSAQIARVVKQRPRDHDGLVRLLGDRPAERFGDAFLGAIANG